MIYDLTFFLGVIVIIFQNLIFGVIIDTFADLRAEKNRKEEQLKNNCFICGVWCVCVIERECVCVCEGGKIEREKESVCAHACVHITQGVRFLYL